MSALSRRGMCDLLFLRLQHQSGMLLPPPPSLLNFPNRVTNGEILNGFTWVLRRRSPPYPQRHLLQGFESSKRSLHIFVEQEDDFLELGPTVPQERRTLSKLMTEKPEHYLKAFPSKNAQVSGADFTMKSALQSVCKSSPASCQKPDSDHNPDTISNHRKDVCNNSSNSVSIKNVPSTVNLAQLIKAASIFGKISSARIRTLPSGLSCCDVEFENESSSQRAAIVGVVKVRSNHLPVCPLHTQETCAIRIQSISKKTTDPAIHSLCQSIGALEGLARAGENAVDAIFSMKNNPDIKGILAKLNNTFVDNCRWSAHLLPDASSSVVKSKYDAAHFGAANDESAVSKILPGIDDRLEAVKANHEMKLIHIEDLKYLHMLVMHLEDV